jgi:hypothetical protein
MEKQCLVESWLEAELKLAYGDVGHPGFSATPIRSTTHFLNAISIHIT